MIIHNKTYDLSIKSISYVKTMNWQNFPRNPFYDYSRFLKWGGEGRRVFFPYNFSMVKRASLNNLVYVIFKMACVRLFEQDFEPVYVTYLLIGTHLVNSE